MEKANVYDIFEQMMRDLIVELPSNPVEHLLDKLSPEKQKESSLVIIVGSKGRKQYALALSEHFGYDCVSVGDLLNKEINKKSDLGQLIQDHKKKYEYVPDEIAIELVMKYVEKSKKEQQPSQLIIEGFPRTRKQAMALVKAGLVPDKFILLEESEKATRTRIEDELYNAEDEEKRVTLAEARRISKRCVDEQNYHMQGVLDVFKGHNVSVVDAGNDQSTVLEDIARVFNLSPANHIPTRAPRVLLCGPPGSGRTVQAKKVAEKFKMVHVTTFGQQDRKTMKLW